MPFCPDTFRKNRENHITCIDDDKMHICTSWLLSHTLTETGLYPFRPASPPFCHFSLLLSLSQFPCKSVLIDKYLFPFHLITCESQPDLFLSPFPFSVLETPNVRNIFFNPSL